MALEEIEPYIADTNMIENYMEAAELAKIIEEFLDTLSKDNMVIFMRRYWFGDSCKDIASYVGITEKNVTVHLYRIREKLKVYLTEREVLI